MGWIQSEPYVSYDENLNMLGNEKDMMDAFRIYSFYFWIG